MTPLHPWFGFLAASLATSRGLFDMMSGLIEAGVVQDAAAGDRERDWATPNRTLRELATMRVLDFSKAEPGSAAIVVAPYALHAATTADFAAGHSVVGALLAGGVTRLHLTDWRSAGPEARFMSIDSYLADLNVMIDDFGAPTALVGLCQGGWLAAAYAARFPAKVSRLVLAGAPIDIAAGPSAIAGISQATAPQTIAELVRLGGGLLLGRLMMAMWPTANPTPRDIDEILQLDPDRHRRAAAALHRRFARWHADVVDLPGVFYRQVTEWIFRENRLARGEFIALGEKVDLGAIACPLFLLAAAEDEIAGPAQVLALAGRVSTPRTKIVARTVPGRHLGLFMGRRTLERDWAAAARFLCSDLQSRPAAA